jgi:hypothetical protein
MPGTGAEAHSLFQGDMDQRSPRVCGSDRPSYDATELYDSLEALSPSRE